MKSVSGTHKPIAQAEEDSRATAVRASELPELLGGAAPDSWDEGALEMAQALANPGKRNRKRFGMSRELRSALTQFVRIGRSFEKANQFRRDYPNFFPAEFWNSWTYSHDIPGSRPIPFWRVWLKLLDQAWHADFHSDYVTQLQAISLYDSALCELAELRKLRCIEINPVHDFQRAVAAMGASPWRAKYCSECSQPFVADKPTRFLCSDKCRKEAQRKGWTRRWEKYGKKWRQKQRTKAKRRRAAG
jgi:hypothetical protein